MAGGARLGLGIVLMLLGSFLLVDPVLFLNVELFGLAFVLWGADVRRKAAGRSWATGPTFDGPSPPRAVRPVEPFAGHEGAARTFAAPRPCQTCGSGTLPSLRTPRAFCPRCKIYA